MYTFSRTLGLELCAVELAIAERTWKGLSGSDGTSLPRKDSC